MDTEKCIINSIKRVRKKLSNTLDKDLVERCYKRGIISDFEYEFYSNLKRIRHKTIKQEDLKKRINLKILMVLDMKERAKSIDNWKELLE